MSSDLGRSGTTCRSRTASVSPSGSVSLRMMTCPQLLMFTGIGRMKSFSCELKASDDRLLNIAEPNDSQTSSSKMKSRSSDISPNVRAASGAPLMPAVWFARDRDEVDRADGLVWERCCRPPRRAGPLAGRDVRYRPALSRWRTRAGGRPRADHVRPVRAGVLDWFSSKSISVVPDGSLHPDPAEVEEPGPSTSGSLVRQEGLQVGLVVRDRAGDVARTGGVFLDPALVRVVILARWLVVGADGPAARRCRRSPSRAGVPARRR